mmetsp:Transcript_46251/g.143271  ORF Transcript_46251/g.143271 Transcript_46251/m.143271 type:complete len:217 (+) Transcript_46251:367-1017(+)
MGADPPPEAHGGPPRRPRGGPARAGGPRCEPGGARPQGGHGAPQGRLRGLGAGAHGPQQQDRGAARPPAVRRGLPRQQRVGQHRLVDAALGGGAVERRGRRAELPGCRQPRPRDGAPVQPLQAPGVQQPRALGDGGALPGRVEPVLALLPQHPGARAVCVGGRLRGLPRALGLLRGVFPPGRRGGRRITALQAARHRGAKRGRCGGRGERGGGGQR